MTFWLFPNLQPNLKGKRSQDVEEVKKTVTVTLKVIPNDEIRIILHLYECFHSWAGRMAAELDSSQGQLLYLLLRIIVDERNELFEKKIFHNRYSFTLRI